MKYTPSVLKEYDGIIEALENAEKALKGEKVNADELQKMHALLTGNSEAVRILGMHPEQRERLEAIVERLKPLLPGPKTEKSYAPQIDVEDSYKQIEFQLYATKHRNGTMFLFSSSLDSIKSAKFERHPLPHEICSLLIAGIEGKLSGAESGLEQGILHSQEQFLSIMFRYAGGILHCYENPENVIGSNNVSNMRYSADRIFNIPNLAINIPYKLDLLAKTCPELVAYLFSRPYEKLPEEIRQKGYVKLGENYAMTFNEFKIGPNYYGFSRGVKARHSNLGYAITSEGTPHKTKEEIDAQIEKARQMLEETDMPKKLSDTFKDSFGK